MRAKLRHQVVVPASPIHGERGHAAPMNMIDHETVLRFPQLNVEAMAMAMT
jgi:hypothetical protein